MPEKIEKVEIAFEVTIELRASFRSLCNRRGQTMSEALRAMMLEAVDRSRIVSPAPTNAGPVKPGLSISSLG